MVQIAVLVLVITLVVHRRVHARATTVQVRAVLARATIVLAQVAVRGRAIIVLVPQVQIQAIVQVLAHRVQAHIAAALHQAVHLPVLQVEVEAAEVAAVVVEDNTNIKQT